MKFVKRLTNPSDDNVNYLRPKKGCNKCIRGNQKHGLNKGPYDVLPNCTGWVNGRWLEAQGYTEDKLPYGSNAETYLRDNKIYEEGFTPRVGSILVYGKGKVGEGSDGAGHVMFVESIDKNGNCLVSESGWNFTRKRMSTRTVKPHKYNYLSGYTYLGCIYPAENFEFHYYGTLPTENLRYGMKGKQVKYLQDFLNWCLGEYLSVDGHFGPATRNAVKKYQEKYGLEIDGHFGPKCRAKAKTITF